MSNLSDRAASLLGTREVRSAGSLKDFEIRQTSDELVIEGYASVFGYRYDMLGGPSKGGWTEVVERSAFDGTLSHSPDVALLLNHEPGALARTKSGTLLLSTDDHGLAIRATLDPANPRAMQLRSAVTRGDMDEMSFAFRTVRDRWNADETERSLVELNIHKGDVSVVDYGASDATSVKLRSTADAIALIRNIDAESAMAELRSTDNPLQALTEARGVLAGLIREMTPSSRRPMSVAEAEAVAAHR